MAVIGNVATIHPIRDFVSSLDDAAQAIACVKISARPRCTGFLIAKDLVLVPAYAFQAKDDLSEIFVQGDSQDRSFEVPLRGAPEILPEIEPGMGCGVLRLAWRPDCRVPPIALDAPGPGAPVTLLHHPQGGPASFSTGFVQPAPPPYLGHDADSVPGSGGGALFDADWRVIGMHMRSGDGANEALSMAAIVDLLRTSRYWRTIARQHRLADATAAITSLSLADAPASAPQPLSPILRAAALSPGFDIGTLSKEEAESLQPLVIDASSGSWVLRPEERRRILRTAGSLRALKPQRRRSRHEVAEGVVDRIIAGPPYALEEESEEALGWWLQMSRWFAEVQSDLPSPSDVARQLEARRLRGRLHQIVGPDFRGRAKQLRIIHDWYDSHDGPLMLIGPGGIGKSSLAAKFAATLPSKTVILWLDFDRADLAPDDAVSVLEGIAEQVALQLPDFDRPRITAKNWKRQADRIGKVLVKVPGRLPPLLLLDSFEAAQYSLRYQQLWPVLERIVAQAPALRLCVTGRAPVPDLTLGGRRAQPLILEGLGGKAARAWLEAHGVGDSDILDRVTRIAAGIPLILRLALRYLEMGGKAADLPNDLPQAMIAGYLYGRILDRVQNPAYRPLASGILVLRRLTADMIQPIFEGLVELPAGDKQILYEELMRELSLVEGGEVLRLRPEVRTATLALLEREKPDLVAQIDRHAADWYARADNPSVEDRAERVYHCLRSADLANAAAAWVDGCGAYLTFAGDDLRDARARRWLSRRLTTTDIATTQDAWEQDAAERIRKLRGRGHDSAIAGILAEGDQRSGRGALAFQEAYQHWLERRPGAARDLLLAGAVDGGPLGHAPSEALLALALARTGRVPEADVRLAHLETRPPMLVGSSDNARLLVHAARLRLTIDLEGEMHLLRDGAGSLRDVLRRKLAPVDVVLPALARLGAQANQSSEWISAAITTDNSSHALLAAVNVERSRGLPLETTENREYRAEWLSNWSMYEHLVDFSGFTQVYQVAHDEALRLAIRGWWRWFLMCREDFLEPSRAFLDEPRPMTPAVSGMVATLMLLLGKIRNIIPHFYGTKIVLAQKLMHFRLEVPVDQWARLLDVMKLGAEMPFEWERVARLEKNGVVTIEPEAINSFGSDDHWLLLYLATPDPLEALVAELAGHVPRIF
ncbi:MAG: trypsin-like peptidase domain-containing protein [Pseudomonadota bacterium]